MLSETDVHYISGFLYVMTPVVSGCLGDYLPQSRHSLVLAAS